MHPVRIYTTPSCGYCVALKRLLDRKGIAYEEIDVAGDPVKRRSLQQVTGRTSVPQVFIDDQPYGGFRDIAALDARGELDELVRRRSA